MRSWSVALFAIPLLSACAGRLLEPDALCTPPDPDPAASCVAEETRLVCPLPDGTKWERLPSGVWLHYRWDPIHILCDVAPDGQVIARSP